METLTWNPDPAYERPDVRLAPTDLLQGSWWRGAFDDKHFSDLGL